MTEQKVSLSFFTAALRSCAFFFTLTMGTPYPCVPVDFQQWERRSHAFPLEMTPGTLKHCQVTGDNVTEASRAEQQRRSQDFSLASGALFGRRRHKPQESMRQRHRYRMGNGDHRRSREFALVAEKRGAVGAEFETPKAEPRPKTGFGAF